MVLRSKEHLFEASVVFLQKLNLLFLIIFLFIMNY